MFARCAQAVNNSTERLCGWHQPPSVRLGDAGVQTIPRQRTFIDDNEAIEDYPVPADSELANFLLNQTAASDQPPVVLFNIDEDPTESKDVATYNPEVVRTLLMRIDELR